MRKRLVALAFLTLNDFHLHLESALNVGYYDPTFAPFTWVFYQGYYFYNAFWSLYWGAAAVLALSLYRGSMRTARHMPA